MFSVTVDLSRVLKNELKMQFDSVMLSFLYTYQCYSYNLDAHYF